MQSRRHNKLWWVPVVWLHSVSDRKRRMHAIDNCTIRHIIAAQNPSTGRIPADKAKASPAASRRVMTIHRDPDPLLDPIGDILRIGAFSLIRSVGMPRRSFLSRQSDLHILSYFPKLLSFKRTMHFIGSNRSSPQPGAAQTKSASQPAMRRSCHFCRSRKIRCSGQSICSACRERNIDCVYGREGSKGRPKGVTSKASTRASHQRSQSNASSSRTKEFEDALTMHHSSSNSPTDAQQASQTTNTPRNSKKIHPLDRSKTAARNSIAADLQHTFSRLFDTPENNPEPCHNALTAFGRKHSQSQASLPPHETLPHPTMTYEDPMFTLIEDFVEMVTSRFGDLGCQELEDRPPPLFKRCLDVDDIQEMFDVVEGQATNPLLQYNNYQTLQMIDIWFSHHPLAFILSKTLLLRSYRDGTQNNVLLAVILADVNFAQREPETRAKGVEMFKWANFQLFEMQTTSIDLSTVQALTLLGWYELCASRARRSLCYFIHASNIVSGLQAPIVQMNQINGMDVGEVEAELARSIRWLTFAVILWAFMQMDAPMLELLPSSLSAPFPPTDETTSAVFRLDAASDNISTLTHQARTIRYLWPICHVASTTAHIYALYPREQTPFDESQTFSWQTQTLLSLRQLSAPQQNTTPRNLPFVCSKIRHVLVNALELISGCKVSQGLLLAAYHTMIVHFLFPRIQSVAESVPVTDNLIEDFCSSARALLRMSDTVDSRDGNAGMTMGLYPETIAETFMLGLDACGRGIAQIQIRARNNSHSEASLTARKEEVEKLVKDLLDLSKHEKLAKTKRAKPVKKQLKQVMQNFDGQNAQNAQLFDFSTFGSNDPFAADTISSLQLPPELVPSMTDSPTIDLSPSSSPSRATSNQGYWSSSHSSMDQTPLSLPMYNISTPYMDNSASRVNWGAADMFDAGIMGDFSTCNPLDLENRDQDGQVRHDGLQVYHKNAPGAACFDDSAFRSL